MRFEKNTTVVLMAGGTTATENVPGTVVQSNHAVTTIRTETGYELTAPSLSFREV